MKNIAIVSGGASGLGLELVKTLHANGYYVCNIDKEEKSLREVDKNFTDNYKSFLGNVADEKFIVSVVEEISKIGNIVALFNNAGSPVFKMPTEYNSQDVELCFEGLKGMIFLSANVLKCMVKSGGG